MEEGSPGGGDSGISVSITDTKYHTCPKCQRTFKNLKHLKYHIEYSCPALSAPDILVSPRRAPLSATKLTHNREVDSLLGTINSDYVKFRLAQLFGVTQSETHPILFNYKWKGSRDSLVSKCCPTSDPYVAMYNVLIDAKNNYNVDSIEMPKKIVIVDSDSETEFEVSKYLVPTRQNARSNRPDFETEEKTATYVYRLGAGAVPDSKVTDDSARDPSMSMSLVEGFKPRYNHIINCLKNC